MGAMPRPRPPHLQRQVTRHGKTVWYVRVGRGPRVRMPSVFGTPEFHAEYQAAIAGQCARDVSKAAQTITGSLAWLIERYRETGEWTRLSLATRRLRENVFRHVVDSAGVQPAAKITSATIMVARDRRTAIQAKHFLSAMRGLFRWAFRARLVKSDPTIGVNDLPLPKNDGHMPWSDGDVAAYEARWPLGTRQRVWFDVLAYTGLRRGDAVRLGRQHLRNGIATIKTEKTGSVVTLPILATLAETLSAGPCGDLTFIAGMNGRPLTKESFGNLFRQACREGGLINRSAHGLQKAAATRATEHGATEAELEAIFGWSGGRMASLYTRAANRQRLSIAAMNKLENDRRTSIPSPLNKVRAPGRKDQ
jgi:integrase